MLVLLSKFLAVLIGIEHSFFLYMEAFAWTTRGRKAFQLPSMEFAVQSLGLAANQGIYNGLLAAGFFFGVAVGSGTIIAFFSALAAAAGIFGATTFSTKILFVQAVPALISATVAILAFDGIEPYFVCSPIVSFVWLAAGMAGTTAIGKACYQNMEKIRADFKKTEAAKK
jgi:putative membrane protein